MVRPTARKIALLALQRWRSSDRFADAIIHDLLDQLAMDPSDRGFAQELFYGVLRNLTLLDFYISRMRPTALDHSVRDLLRLGLYQLMLLRTPSHAAVFETVELSPRKTRPIINAILRSAIRQKDDLETAAGAAPPHIRESHPEFLVSRWTHRFGPEVAARLFRWDNEAAPIYARINTLKISRQKLPGHVGMRELAGVPLFVECDSLPAEALAQGHVYIQDPSTKAAVDLLHPKPNERILDACAAPGGKTGYIAAVTGNRATVVASDRDPLRLDRLRDNLTRLGVTADVVQHDWLDQASKSLGQFDKILLDAPCTNTGVMRRRVDLRWRVAPGDFKRMREHQEAIFRAVIRLLKPGGAVVYSTCSLEREENEDVVEEILREHVRLRLDSMLSVLPFRDGFDGAFAARFTLAI